MMSYDQVIMKLAVAKANAGYDGERVPQVRGADIVAMIYGVPESEVDADVEAVMDKAYDVARGKPVKMTAKRRKEIYARSEAILARYR